MIFMFILNLLYYFEYYHYLYPRNCMFKHCKVRLLMKLIEKPWSKLDKIDLNTYLLYAFSQVNMQFYFIHVLLCPFNLSPPH